MKVKCRQWDQTTGSLTGTVLGVRAAQEAKIDSQLLTARSGRMLLGLDRPPAPEQWLLGPAASFSSL